MKRGVVVLALVLAALSGAGRAAAAIQVAITSPIDGAHSLSSVVNVDVSASADSGIYSVQLYVDDRPYGMPDPTQVGLCQYEIPWDTSGFSPGDHTLSALATDWSGAATTLLSSATPVNVGPPYPTIAITSPAR